MAPRPYDLGRRRSSTESTRQKILEATRALIGGKGDLDQFSMEAVAEKAGVARMTVYYQFRSRAGLLEALADDLATRGGMMRLREAFVEPDPEEAVRKFVRTFVDFWATDRVTMRRLRAMGVVFPGLYHGPRSRDDWRREGAVNLLAKLGRFELGGAKAPRATEVDLLTTLTSFETFDSLAGESHSAAAVAEVLTDATLTLFGFRRKPPAVRAPTPARRGKPRPRRP